MIRINENYRKLQTSYLFNDIAQRVARYIAENPDQAVIKMGIGDATEPLPEACRAAFHRAG